MAAADQFHWQVGDKDLCRGRSPLLMGILNVTPDSFSDGGLHTSTQAAVDHGVMLAAAGADIIDVGGESTRPGAQRVSIEEELQRVVPVVQQLTQKTSVPISVDTTKATVAQAAMDAGAAIINDISGMTFDPEMIGCAARTQAAVCLMHIRGTPQTMQDNPVYDDVIADVSEFLRDRLTVCTDAGISADRICLDPGIGFGKTADHNLQLMRQFGIMRQQLGRPFLIGHSRKRFLSKVLGRSVEERLAGTLGVSVALAANGADILRVHDVAATRDAITAWQAVLAESA